MNGFFKFLYIHKGILLSLIKSTQSLKKEKKRNPTIYYNRDELENLP
jgi:hypothetical protein